MAISLADIRSGIAAGCDRLINPSIADAGERQRQGDLLFFLMSVPFVGAIVTVMAMQPAAEMAVVLAAACAIFGLAWGMALLLIWSGRFHAVLATAAVFVMFALALTGASFGLGSPVILAAAAIPLAMWRILGSGRAVAAAAVGTASALVIGSVMSGLLWMEPVGASAVHWLAPALAGALGLLRIQAVGRTGARIASKPALPAYLDQLDAAVLQIGGAGEVEAFTPNSANLFGLDPSLMLGKGLFERIHVADRVAFRYAVSAEGSSATPSQLVLRIRLPGEDETGERASNYRSFRGEICRLEGHSGVVLLLRQAGEEEALRRQLAEARARVEEIEITKGRFLAAVSHELRTPLNAIIGFSDVLLHTDISDPLQPKQAEQVGLIREAGGHLLQVVNAILDVSKIESGTYRITREPFSLREAVDFTCSMMKKEADEKGLQLSARIPHMVGEVLADQRAVQQILINLLSNAIKFTPSGGTIRIAATRRDGEVSVRVSDTGIGIAQQDLNRLCRPFMQVQNDYTRQFQGTGLGLSLVKGLIGLHGGRMAIESAPGLGTAVTFTLPLAASDDEQGDKAASSAAATQITDMQDDQEIQKIA